MWFNVIKGSYPTLQQVDKALPVDATPGAGTLERGSCLVQSANSTWTIAQAADAGSATVPGKFVWFALQPSDDLVARMAGVPENGAPGRAVINALACSPTCEIETDMFVQPGLQGHATLIVGDMLQVVNEGKLGLITDGATACAQVTRTQYHRWVNNAVAVVGFRTGNVKNVIRAITMYVPSVVLA
jgi:hypothetical protein